MILPNKQDLPIQTGHNFYWSSCQNFKPEIEEIYWSVFMSCPCDCWDSCSGSKARRVQNPCYIWLYRIWSMRLVDLPTTVTTWTDMGIYLCYVPIKLWSFFSNIYLYKTLSFSHWVRWSFRGWICRHDPNPPIHFNPFENIMSKWIISPGKGQKQKCLKPTPRCCWKMRLIGK